ncbi:PREDICTED: MATH domain and coiled-coil domain-containing protein At3g27040-like [Camelina sativa]|uniref:MATH domain and coiled-coil domain-containing protein At3g27040-like n=1 Tax=Camelina sativa TaxID=90675 RepID=A0ABM0TSW3_CAMSA|nr:PREDICTED: MATH domain and coiled-coil domain-containing protein At3g27040-like [Camelina sativa]
MGNYPLSIPKEKIPKEEKIPKQKELFTWVVRKLSSIDPKGVYSDTFVADRCKWRLLAYPMVYSSISSEREYWFDQTHTSLDISKFDLPDYMIHDEVKIVAEVDVFEVIGEVDVPEETKGSIDINGFQVPASQVEFVKSLFKKHPGFVSRLCPKNPHLRKAYLNVILSLTETLSKSPDELSNGDLVDAYSALRFVTNAGFKLDWLEKKLKKTGGTRLQEIEQELEDLKVKRADILRW